MREITYSDRVHAARIVNILRNKAGRRKVATQLGISPIYVTFIEKMTKRAGTELKYQAPAWTINKVLEQEGASAA